MKPEDRKRLKQHIEMIVEHKEPIESQGEDFAKYIVSRNCTLPDVSMTQDVSTDIKTPSSIENTNPDYYKQELASRDALIERLVEAGTMVLAYSLPMNETGAKWRMAWQPLVTEWKAMKGGE